MKLNLLALWMAATFSLLFSASGGPDAFGYRWVDSDEIGGPVFNWIDITSTGTRVSLYDDDGRSLTMSRYFEYYGVETNQISFSGNGWAMLAPSFGSWPYYFTALPSTANPNSWLAILATDLYPPTSPGAVYYQEFPDKFVIEWHQICEIGRTPDPAFTFQIILNFARKEIIYQYLEISPLYSHTAYIGIENQTGTVGLLVGTYSSAGGILHNNYAIRFRATPVASPGYGNNFETETDDFTLGDASGWEWGPIFASSPAYPPHSGARCYATNLTGNYANNADWILIAPIISASGVENPVVDFWHYYRTESGHDGGIVEISTNEGLTWETIEPEGGYPVLMTTGPLSGQRAFSGSTPGWQKVFFDLSEYADMEVSMRLRFRSDASVTDVGWYVDDFGYHEAYGVLEGNIDLLFFEPDSGVLVEIVDRRRTCITNNEGYFRFDSVAIGSHRLRISRERFITDSMVFSVARFDTTRLSLSMRPMLYNENFEATNGDMIAIPDTGWNCWQWGVPAIEGGPSAAHSGSKCWGTNLLGNYGNNSDLKLLLQMPLYDVQWPVMYVWTWYKFYGEWVGMLYDGGNVKISADTGATWEILHPIEGYDGVVGTHNDFLGGQPAFGGMESGDFWHILHFPLYEYAGLPVVLIIFELGSDESFTARGWYIDDIMLTSDSSFAGIKQNVSKVEKPLLSVSPNPFNSAINIQYRSSGAAVMSVLDISGKMVENIPIGNEMGFHNITWQADGLPGGVYLLRLEDKSGIEIKRIVLIK